MDADRPCLFCDEPVNLGGHLVCKIIARLNEDEDVEAEVAALNHRLEGV